MFSRVVPVVLAFAIVILVQDSGYVNSAVLRASFTDDGDNSTDEHESCRIVDKVLKHTEEWTHPETCTVFFCYEGLLLDVDFCNELEMKKPNCFIVPIRPNVEFPHCCPKVVCD